MIYRIPNESLFLLSYKIKKLVPRSEIFHVLFMLFKYIGPFLLTHNLKSYDSNSFLFYRIFNKLVLLQGNNLYYLSNSYAWISLFILILIVVLLLLFLMLILYYRKKIKEIALVSFGIPSTKIRTGFFVKIILKILAYFTMVMLFLSQHIVEYLFFAIFASFSSLIDEKYFITAKYDKLKAFQRNLPINLTILAILNSLSILLLYLITFYFIILSSSQSIKYKYGSQAIPKKGILFGLLILYQFQGLYAVYTYFIETYQHQFRLYSCIGVIALLGLFICLSLRKFNYRSTASIFFIDFMNIMCFISGILEILEFYFFPFELTFSISLIKTALEVGNAFFLVIIIMRRNRSNALEYISNSIFVENSNPENSSYSIEFFTLIAQYSEGKDVFHILYQTFILHFQKCTKEKCSCCIIREELLHKKYEDEKKEIIRILSLIVERNIVHEIILNNQHHTNSINQLMILHIDYLYSILNNHYMTMYMCQYYLFTQHHNITGHSAYVIYEIYRMNIEDIKSKNKKQKKYIIDNNEIKEINHLKLQKKNKKDTYFLKRIQSLDKIKKLLLICCREYEKIMKYRRIRKTNKPMQFTCEEFLDSILIYKDENVLLFKLLNEYLAMDKIEIGEECYLLNFFFNLFNGGIPKEFHGKIQKMHSFMEVYYDSSYTQFSFMILSLSMSNEFIIQYATTNFIEEIHCTRNEIIGTNFHNTILAGPFSEYHFAQMKMFLTNTPNKIRKDTFVITKENFLYPVNVTISPLPTRFNLSMIIKLKAYNSSNTFKGKYYAYLDHNFSFALTCSFFQNRFIFNSKMLNEANINYLQFFGLNHHKKLDQIKEKEKSKQSNWFDQFNKTKSIQTTVKFEDHHLYYHDQYLLKKPKVILYDTLSRKTFSKAIAKIKLSVEGTAMDKGWLKSIHDLYVEVSQKGIHPNQQYANIKDIIFDIKLEIKKICNMSYYISTITENNQEALADQIAKAKVITTQFPQTSMNCSLQIYEKDSLINNNDPISICFDQNNVSSILENKNNAVNDSNVPLFSNQTKLYNSNIPSRYIARVSQNDEKKEQEKSSDKHQKIFILKLCSWFCFVGSFIVIIVNMIINKSSYAISRDLFYINNYFFLLSADIYFSGIGCLRSCLITNKILSGNYDLLLTRIHLGANDMIQHFHQLTFYINDMNTYSEINIIYDILYSADTYELMQTNGKSKKRQSTFPEEISQIYFYLSYFNPRTPDKCRLEELFFNKNYRGIPLDSSFVTTLEERFLYYIFQNLITIIGDKISLLNLETNNILRSFIDISKRNLVLLNCFILSLGIALYLFVLILLFFMKAIFRNNLSNIFDYIIGEDTFFDEILQLSNLLSNFSSQQCYLFENKKNSKSIKELNSPGHNTNKTTGKEAKSFSQMKSKSSRGKDKKQEDNAFKEEDQYVINKNFNNFSRLYLINSSIGITFLLLIMFIGIEIWNIVISIKTSHQKQIDSDLTLNVLTRVPKFGELVLYSAISFLSNDQYLITKNQNEYDKSIVSNYYQITLDLTRNSVFQNLGNSYYAFIYYQIYIARENIKTMRGDNSQKKTIPITRSYDILFNDNENMCLYLSTLDIQYSLNPPSLITAFKEASIIIKECRVVAGGINLSGLMITLDLLLNEFTELYIGIFKIPPEQNTLNDFFGHNSYSNIDEDTQTTLKILHDVFSFLIEEDMLASYSNSNMIEIIFLIISVIFCCVVIFIIILLYVIKFEKYNSNLEEFLLEMNNSIKNLCS